MVSCWVEMLPKIIACWHGNDEWNVNETMFSGVHYLQKVWAAGESEDKPVVAWKSKTPRILKGVHYKKKALS